ncbi:hypothetical protein D210916BOD24_18040 [Alteromonas sp. D210916BOD_24]|uniref:hypothetical protein n=1 Tax=Alteromonas sp. D210916BOD_24 TaxID=3157618 RepID=UPI00399CA27E
MSSVFNALKQETQANHARLECTYPFLSYQCVENLTSGAYADILSVMALFHQAAHDVLVDASASRAISQVLAQHANGKDILTALDCDQRALATVSRPVSKPQPPNVVLPTFHSSVTSSIAALYVWLGSSMGANIILRRLINSDKALPTHYYSAMANASKQWISFKFTVESEFANLIADEVFTQHLVDDANSWFEYLICLGTAHLAKPELTSSSEHVI